MGLSTSAAGSLQDPPAVKYRILVVDDEASIEKLVSGKLRAGGHDCRGCHSGFEALDLISSVRFDAVISDLRMPGMDGLDLLRSVRGKHPHMGFIVATGAGDVRSGVQAMKDGADDFLQKPLDFDALTVTLSRVLQRKKLQIEVENYRANLERIVEERTQQLIVATRRIELSYDDTLQALAAALDLRDDATAGHSRRVMAYSILIARAMHCDPEEIKTIARGALLHDIGKIGIPDSILLQPKPLDEAQRSIMETHVRIGHELLSHIAFLAGPVAIVLTHHERFDGTGYPQGLKGTQIPLGARIFAVADTLDAITSNRPYRKARPYAIARGEILRWSGRQFDPAVVAAFLSIDEHTWEATEPRESICRVGPAESALFTSVQWPKLECGVRTVHPTRISDRG